MYATHTPNFIQNGKKTSLTGSVLRRRRIHPGAKFGDFPSHKNGIKVKFDKRLAAFCSYRRDLSNKTMTEQLND